MKILIASDIHGSAEYAEQFLEAVRSEEPDKILLLGDLLYHGPRNALPEDYDTKRTMEILNGLKGQDHRCARQLRCGGRPDGA